MIWENDLSAIREDTTLFWFRRDLRLTDNAGLYFALKECTHVVPVFIFDTQILDQLEDRRDARIEFILESLQLLRDNIENHGGSLIVLFGDPVQLFRQMAAKVVYTNRDYEPYAKLRDDTVSAILASRGGELKCYKDQVIFDQSEVTKPDGKPYTVFTPYSKVWRANLTPFHTRSYPTEKYADRFLRHPRAPFPTLEQIGFLPAGQEFPPRHVPRATIATYDETRNIPAIRGTTRLSIHLRFGTVSIRSLVRIALTENQAWLNELIWRDFYHMILFHYPQVETQAFKPAYDRIIWRNNESEFAAWCEGRTGYPLVDAGMRELNETGFMHNRLRMITASFLTKHLLIDWRWGERYFAMKLLDYDMAANNGGWQWAAGTGCDAAPYFRIFNPLLQQQKFDPNMEYVMHWVPEFQSSDYPRPIVDHVTARERVLRVYREGLTEGSIVRSQAVN
jgi:deoxyribodipyrimidine photo-lyase